MMRMRNVVNVLIGAAFLAGLAALGMGQQLLEQRADAQAKSSASAPRFEVDPFWPKPLPNHWILGSTIGVSVDFQDHVWIIHRGAATLDPKELWGTGNPPASACCAAAPPVLEFDQAGNLLNHWGGPGQGFEWPESNHGITVDSKGIVWIGGNGASDGHILKFTRDGKFVKQFGFQYASAGSNDMWAFGRVAKVFLDEASNEAYVADGYGNKRVAVIDMDSGKIKRYWGAYGNKPNDANLGPYNPSAPPAQQFRNPVHCAEMSKDGFVYACDRANDRVQVFRKDGTFVKEVFVEKNTRGDGSAWDLTFSKDPDQKFFFLADGANDRIHVFDRASLTELTSFGDGGRQPGQFYAVHSIASDSKGNLYTTETYEGKRVQRFLNKGIAPVTKEHQGTPWPKSTK